MLKMWQNDSDRRGVAAVRADGERVGGVCGGAVADDEDIGGGNESGMGGGDVMCADDRESSLDSLT